MRFKLNLKPAVFLILICLLLAGFPHIGAKKIVDNEVEKIVISINCQSQITNPWGVQLFLGFRPEPISLAGTLDWSFDQEKLRLIFPSGAQEIGSISAAPQALCNGTSGFIKDIQVNLRPEFRLHLLQEFEPCKKHNLLFAGGDPINFSIFQKLSLTLPDGQIYDLESSQKKGFSNLGNCQEGYNAAIGLKDESCRGKGSIDFALNLPKGAVTTRVECQPSARNPKNADIPLCTCREPLDPSAKKCRVYPCTIKGVESK